ncbi:MAG: hypothetical protein WAQ41_05680, partial [bacterium]
MAMPVQDLLKGLGQLRERLEGTLPPARLETLLAGWLLARAWRDRGYCSGDGGLTSQGLPAFYPSLAAGELAALWEDWEGLWDQEGVRVKEALGETFLGDMAVEDLSALYSYLQHPRRRRRLGAYYSPPEIVDFILGHT